jgi:hypothetical protein
LREGVGTVVVTADAADAVVAAETEDVEEDVVVRLVFCAPAGVLTRLQDVSVRTVISLTCAPNVTATNIPRQIAAK